MTRGPWGAGRRAAIVGAGLAGMLWAVTLQAAGFPAGERLQFNLHWMGIPAGTAVFETQAPAPESYRIDVRLVSTGPVRLFFDVQDTMSSQGRVNANGQLQVVEHLLDQREGDREKLQRYRFDPVAGQVHRQVDDGPWESHPMVASVLSDPLTVVYALRDLTLWHPGETVPVAFVSGDKQYHGHITLGRPKRLFTPIGGFEAAPVEVVLDNSKSYNKPGKLKVWFSLDELRLPLRVDAEIKVGTVYADLVGFSDSQGRVMTLRDR
ncbi:MAG: DUF3108 domain-containing protein [Magnetococcus sp. WYHC-3]